MNKDNDLRAKLQARHQQNLPKGKRPAAIAAGTAVAPVKRQKLDQIHQRKAFSQPTSTHTQGTSSTATQNHQTIHLPNLFPAKKIVKQTKPHANLPTDATSRKEHLSEKPQQSSKNDQILMQIDKELKILKEFPIQSEMPPAEFNQEYFSNLSLPKAIEMLQTFGHNPLDYSKMIEFMVEKKYQIEKDTLLKIMPFLRSYQLIGATCVEKFLSYYRGQLCELDQSFKIKNEQF